MTFVHAVFSPLLFHLPMDSQLWLAVLQLMTFCDVYAFYIIGFMLLILAAILLNWLFSLPKFLKKSRASLANLSKLSRLNLEKLKSFFN